MKSGLRWPANLIRLGMVGALLASGCQANSLSITQYVHTSWSQRNGFDVSAVHALAQTADGYLWVGAGRKLLRFDGVRFVDWKPQSGDALPGNRVTLLRPAAGGGLWIGTSGGIGALEQQRRRVASFTAREGLPAGSIISMVEDHAGALWAVAAGSTSGVVAVQKGKLRRFGVEDGLPDAKVLSLLEDADRRLWVATSGGVCRWTPERKRCDAIGASGVTSLAADPVGRVLLVGGAGRSVFRLSEGKLERLFENRSDGPQAITVALADHDGRLWIGTLGRGLYCLHDGMLDHYTQGQGLSSDLVEALVEDREGNIWAGTASGLDRFRKPKVVRYSSHEGLPGNLISAVCAGRDGGVWAATSGGLVRLQDGRVTSYLEKAGLPRAMALALHEDAAGRLWVSTSMGLGYISRDRFIPVGFANGGKIERGFVMAEGPDGILWLADSSRGLLRIRHDRAEPVILDRAAAGKDIYQLYSGRSGRLWLGYFQGGVAVMEGNSVRSYGAADGLAPGTVQSIYEDSGGTVWAGTEEGLSRLRDGRWTSWTARHGLPDGGIQGIVEGDGGVLWLESPAGLLRLDRAGLDGAGEGKLGAESLTLYGPGDGIQFPGNGKMSNPRMARSADGRLWISTEDGLAMLDPRELPVNRVEPPVVIERIAVDGRPLDTTDGNAAFQGREVQFQFTALSLTRPEAVRFRYKLEGADRDWSEPIEQRQITYANLAPRSYRLRVIAANSDGVWNEQGAGLDFQVQPYFYQSPWFAVPCAIAVGMAGYGVHWLRVRRLRSRFQLVLRERSRLARELHDTLLQGFTGVVYHLEASWRQLDRAPETSRQSLHRALTQADQSLSEVRHAVSCLRIPALETDNLPDALSKMGKHLVEESAIVFEMQVSGRVRPLSYDVESNLYVIAREAVSNAVNHAKPRLIRLELSYARSVSLSVQDDGAGFDLNVASAKANHWGLVGMRERAKQVGGILRVDAREGQGSRVEATIPLKPVVVR